MVSLFTEQAACGREHFAKLSSTKEGKATIQKIAQGLQGSKSALIQYYFDQILPVFAVEERNDVKAWLEYKWQAKEDAAFLQRVAKSLAKWLKVGVRPLAEKEEIQAIKLEIERKKQAQQELLPNYNTARNPCTEKVSAFLNHIAVPEDQEPTPLENALSDAQYGDYAPLLEINIPELPPEQQVWIVEILELKRKVHLWRKLWNDIRDLDRKRENLVNQTSPIKILQDNLERAMGIAYSHYECPILNFRRDVRRSKAKEGGIALREEMLKTLFAFEPDVEAILTWRHINIHDFLEGDLAFGLNHIIYKIDESQETRDMTADGERALKAAFDKLSEEALRHELVELVKWRDKFTQHLVDAVRDLAQLSVDPPYQNEMADVLQALDKLKQDANIREFYNFCRKKSSEVSYKFPKEIFYEFLNKHKCFGFINVHTQEIEFYTTTPKAILDDVASRLQEHEVIYLTKMIELCQEALKAKM